MILKSGALTKPLRHNPSAKIAFKTITFANRYLITSVKAFLDLIF